jgi:hypothetical protein
LVTFALWIFNIFICNVQGSRTWCDDLSWAVRGLMGRIGKPIRVRLGIRLDPFLGVKVASLYKERTCTR